MVQISRQVKEFEFYYLAELTRQRIKPLSRWEKPLPQRANQWLRHNGLHVERISRKTLSGKTIAETVFSASSKYTDVYQRKFSNTFICKSAENQKLEGFLFGYPSCCVRQFIRHPYSPNNIDESDQSLLFHWACDACRSTHGLIPYYQSIHDSVSEWYHQEFPDKKRVRNHPRLLCNAIAALLITGGGCLSAQTIPDSTHYIPLPDDININGLSRAEEIYLGVLDHGDLSECQTFAKFFKAIIDSLPNTVQADRPYRINHFMRGLIQCPKCGLYVNMGYASVIDPLRRLQMNIPYLGLHFMEKGFFSFGDDADYQRVDIDTLKKIIYPFDTEHLLPIDGDVDGDGLADNKEDSLWIEYTADNPDFNNDGLPDGAGIAEELIRLFPKLNEQTDGMHSSVEFKPVWGMENCQVCGSTHNMGTIEITNPENNRTCQIPYIGLHALAHGSFAYNGTVHENMLTDVIELYRTMKTHLLFVGDDRDNDGLKDEEETFFGLDPNRADTNDDGLCDGMELAVSFARMIQALPTEPCSDQPYVEFLDMDGIHLCAVCGNEIPMGVIKIYNPLIDTTPFELTYYAFHFLEKGSFACEGADETRTDPIVLSRFLGYPAGIHGEPESSIPAKFKLKHNFPNPFNPETVIPYSLTEKSRVSLKIYDIGGHEICTLVDRVQTPGDKFVIWDGTASDHRPVHSGLYLCILTVNGVSQTGKMLLLE